MRWTIRILLFIICGQYVDDDVFGQTQALSVDKPHIPGVAESHLASLEAWRTGDMLIRYSTAGEGKLIADEVGEVIGPDALSLVVQEYYLSRFVFDFESERVLVIKRVEREERLFNALDEEIRQPVRTSGNRVMLYDKIANYELQRIHAGEIRRSEIKVPISGSIGCIGRMGVLDLRHLGCVEGINWDFDALREQVRFNNSVDNIEQITHIAKDVYRIVAKDLEMKRYRGRYVTDWDVQRNVPVRFESHHVPDSTNPVRITTVDWKSIDGLFVPESARMSRRSIATHADREFHLREETTVDVHWFSLNTELPAELFAEALIHDRKKLDEMLNTDVFEDPSKEDRKDK
ncbi:MAG: hypothetical protein Q8M16_17295 [Pirellulaceae bacterium]|nr:hypothetical protein [Pirellulaceae bacterium]